MKRFISIIALMLVALLLFSACAPEANDPSADSETEATTDAPDTSDTSGNDDDDSDDDDNDDGGNDEQPPVEPLGDPIISTYKESIKILAVGNSFSVDAMEHLAVILKDAGVKEVVLGNLYIAGCTVWNHWNHTSGGAKENQADYKFYVNKGNGWTDSMETMKTGLLYEDWDIITVQQASPESGNADSLGKLPTLIDYIKSTTPNKDVKLLWHMTWAYQQDSTHSGFSKYNNDQMTMYNAITNLVKTKINTNDSFTGFLPSGTAIQNLRTSYLGDTLTRDGYHMSLDIGRYTAALMWFKELTGAPISGITAVPTAYPNITEHLPAIKDAVNNAYASKLQVTRSAFPGNNTPPIEQTPVDLTAMTDADKAHLTGLGLNPENYKVLDLELTLKAYYNSTSTNVPVASLVTNQSNCPQFMATKIFTVDTLPVGAVINITDGYKYRIEGWQSLDAVNSQTRLDNSTEDFVLSASTYEKYNYIAFNISKSESGTVSDADKTALRIYVPVS